MRQRAQRKICRNLLIYRYRFQDVSFSFIDYTGEFVPMHNAKIKVGLSKFGKGIFSKDSISLGESILTFEGTLAQFDDVLAKGEKSMNAMQIGRGIYIDLGAPGVLVNHSCEPNAYVTSALTLVAVRQIEVGEEIFYDYSTVMCEKYETMKCECRCASCRNIIGDFDLLPLNLRHSYLHRGMVPSFIIGVMSLFNLEG